MSHPSAATLAARYGLDVSKTEQALAAIDAGEVMVLSASGHIGAGKDTTAPLLLDALGFNDRRHEFFAFDLKNEVSQVITLINAADTRNAAAEAVAEAMSIPTAQAIVMTAYLWDEVKSGKVTDAYDRTKNSRSATQYWGTEVRRAQDQDYWVKKPLARLIDAVLEGKSAFVTDARFENEIQALENMRATTLRLVVSPEEQARRILARDGVVMTEEARTHDSEIALDEREARGGFDIIVKCDGKTIDEIVAEAAALARTLTPVGV